MMPSNILYDIIINSHYHMSQANISEMLRGVDLLQHYFIGIYHSMELLDL